MSVAVITGTSNLNPLEVDVAKVAVVELDPRTRHLLEVQEVTMHESANIFGHRSDRGHWRGNR